MSRRIDDVNRVCGALPGLYAEYDSVTAEKRRLEEDLSMAHRDELSLRDWETLDGIYKEAGDAEAEAERILDRFPSGIPSDEETEKAEACLAREAALSSDFGTRLKDEDAARLRGLEEVFSSGVPDDGTLSGIESLIGERTSIEAESNASQRLPVTDRYAALSQRFSGRVPDGKEMRRLKEAADACDVAERARFAAPDRAHGTSKTGKGISAGPYIAVAVVSAVVMASGIGVMFLNLIAGIALLFAGILVLAVDAFVYLSRRQNASSSGASDPDREKAERAAIVARKTVQDILFPYGYTVEGSVRYAVETFERDLGDYLAVSGEMDARRGNTEAGRDRLSAIDRRLDDFFAGYGIRDGDYGYRMSRLRGFVAEYRSLAEAVRRYGEGDRARSEALSENSGVIGAYCSRYGFSSATLRDDLPFIKKDVSVYRDAVRRRDACSERAERFRKERNLTSRPAARGLDAVGMQGTINELNARLDRLSRDIDDCENRAETLDGLNSDLARLSALLDEYTEDHKILTAAASFISDADRNLRDRNFVPIRDGFSRYADMLERAIGERMVMKPDFELAYEAGGSERSDRHLSSGQRSICTLCFRIALIENMYKDDRPFVILDDPFAHLDAKHFAKVKTLLKGLSKDIQIIYFTCHQSRVL